MKGANLFQWKLFGSLAHVSTSPGSPTAGHAPGTLLSLPLNGGVEASQPSHGADMWGIHQKSLEGPGLRPELPRCLGTPEADCSESPAKNQHPLQEGLLPMSLNPLQTSFWIKLSEHR